MTGVMLRGGLKLPELIKLYQKGEGFSYRRLSPILGAIAHLY